MHPAYQGRPDLRGVVGDSRAIDAPRVESIAESAASTARSSGRHRATGAPDIPSVITRSVSSEAQSVELVVSGRARSQKHYLDLVSRRWRDRCMGNRKTLNPRRLTKRQVAELVATGATLREDLMRPFENTYASGYVSRPKVYELEGDRFLFVFDENDVSIPGKGDIYPGDYFRRFARWHDRVRQNALIGATSSVGHWRHYSKVGETLPSHIDDLLAELASAVHVAPEVLDFSYPSLDIVSRHVDSIGMDAAIETLYDHLVAYVGEVMRRRAEGSWRIDDRSTEPFPYIEATQHGVIMPINVVWEQLDGLNEVDFRKAAANELRSARARAF